MKRNNILVIKPLKDLVKELSLLGLTDYFILLNYKLINNYYMRKRVGRPCLKRKVNFNPKVNYFKPQGVRIVDLDVVLLKKEEVEAIRLKNIENFDQKECAKKMHTSAATFQRILTKANKKIAIALIKGKAIKIIND